MKKFILSVVALLGLVFTTNAQLVVDAEMFKSNPTTFMGKTITIKNVTYKETNNSAPTVAGATVSAPTNGVSTGAPVGIAGPSAGPAKSAYCNPQPNLNLTKWVLGPNNTICVQTDAKTKPALDRIPAGSVAKSITFRVTPTMYLMTRIEP